MHFKTYELKSVPDLTLMKYQVFGAKGIPDIIDRHNSFLRQWHRISTILEFGVHLYIDYNPERSQGDRIRISLILSSEDLETLNLHSSLILSSPLSDYFKITENSSLKGQLEKSSFSYVAVLKKKERVSNSGPISTDDKIRTFYVVEQWKSSEKARLYDLLKIMSSINKRVVYCCSFYGIDAYDMVNDSLQKPVSFIRKRLSTQHSLGMGESFELRNTMRDVTAETTLKSYEEFIDAVSRTPHFKVNIKAYANEPFIANIILDAACGEAIENGDCDVYTPENFEDPYSLLPNCNRTEDYNVSLPAALMYWPTLFSLEELSPFFRFPLLNDGESIDIRKETDPYQEKQAEEIERGLYLGKSVLDYKVNIPIDLFTKHAFVCGVPGSGKTNTMLHLCYTLWSKFKIPFLVLEPAKKEYRSLAKTDIDKLLLFSPSSGSQFPLAINPFQFPMNMSLSEHIQNLLEVFRGAFPLIMPLPAILDRAIETIYQEKGWDSDDINDGIRDYPTMSQLYKQLEKELEKTNYHGEIRDNLQAMLEMRIGGLLRRDLGNLFDVEKSTITPENWLKYPIIVELESLGAEPANFLTLMLCTLIRETLRADPLGTPDKSVRHALFIEEAHNLIAPDTGDVSAENANPKLSATNFIVKMLAEVRALREAIIIADQLPTAMPSEVIKNTGLKIVHKITSGDDRELVGSTMSASSIQIEELVTYVPGCTLVSYEGLLKPFKMQVVPFQEKASISTDELVIQMKSRTLSKEAISRAAESKLKRILINYQILIDSVESLLTSLTEIVETYQPSISIQKDQLFCCKVYELTDRFVELCSKLDIIDRKCKRMSLLFDDVSLVIPKASEEISDVIKALHDRFVKILD